MVRSLLPVALILLSGCGRAPEPTAPTPAPAPSEPASAASVPKPEHEMDPAKQTIPDSPAAGRLAGQPFQPDRVSFENKGLVFRQGAGFFADLQLGVTFADYKPNEAVKLVVKPSQKWHEGTIPSLQISVKKPGDEVPHADFKSDGYALTLELAPRVAGRIAGRIFLSLPGDDKSFIAGTFAAIYERELNEPPEPEDRPDFSGSITHAGQAGQTLHLRYVGVPTGSIEPISDAVSSKLGQGAFFATRTTSYAPRTVGLRIGKMGEEYDCTRLPPGKYFVLARVDDGSAGWKLVDVAADSNLDVPLVIPSAAVGSLDVTVPASATGQVQAIPAGLKLDDPSGTLTTAISGALGAYDSVSAGKATLKSLAPGRYEVSLRSGVAVYRGEVEVEPGKAAKVELK